MKISFLLMILFWVVMITFALLDPYFSASRNEQNYWIASIIITSIAMFMWFLADAREQNFSVSRGMKIAVLAVGYIALPFYLIKYKGWKGAAKSFCKFVGLFAIYIIILIAQEHYFSINT